MIKARKEDKARYIRAIKWGHKHGLTFNGFYYDEELAGPDGMSYEILIPSGTKNKDADQAIRQMWDEQDVVRFTCVVIPREWIEEAISHAVPDYYVMDKLLAIADGSARESHLVWPDRSSLHVDPTTANMLATVYKAASVRSKITIKTRVNTSQQDFLQVVDLAWACIKN